MPAAASFEAGVVRAVRAAKDAFARMIEYRCPGGKAVTALCEAFGVHRKLAWQVSKVAYTDDPFVAARFIPRGKGLDAWLEAARNAGVPRALVEAGREAAAAFDTLAAKHTSGREELEMLLESCAGARGAVSTDDAESHTKWREQSFRGNSFVWGAHCRVLMALLVLTPSEDLPDSFHCVQVRGLMGYRQTRAGVRWVVNQGVVADGESNVERSVRRSPLDPAAARLHGGVPVLPDFCSSPAPRLARRERGDGVVLDEFVSQAIGQAGERTLVTGEIVRNLGSMYASPGNTFAHFGTGVRIPTRLMHFDLFVHRSLFGGPGREHELRMFSDLASPAACGDADMLPIPERIVQLGTGVSLAHTPDIPGYADLALGVFDRLGADAEQYDLLRVRVEYPPMPVSVMFRLRFPPRP